MSMIVLFLFRNFEVKCILCFSAGIKVVLHSESVNYNKNEENELLTYFREGRNLNHDMVMLNKSSYIPPILAILFFNGQASFNHVSYLFKCLYTSLTLSIIDFYSKYFYFSGWT